MRSNDSICTEWRLQMRRHKLLRNFSDCLVRSHTFNHLCLSSPDWPAEINKIPDSKYWSIRTTRTKQSDFFHFVVYKNHLFWNEQFVTQSYFWNNFLYQSGLIWIRRNVIWKGLSFIWIIVLHEFNQVPVHWICLTLKILLLVGFNPFQR